jgi:hypothetical protein
MGDWLAHAKILEAGHTVEWISGATGALGAILGSAVTVISTEFFNRRTRRREFGRRNHSAAFAVYQKLNKIYSTARTIHQHYLSFRETYNPNTGPQCLSFRGMFFDSAPVWFSIEEREGIWDTSGPQLVNQIQALDASYNFLLNCVGRYEQDRQKLMDALVPDSMDGPVGNLTSIDVRLLPKIAELEMMIEQAFPMAGEICDEGFAAMRDLVYSRGKPLGKQFKISLKTPDGETVEFRAEDAPRPPKRRFEVWQQRR